MPQLFTAIDWTELQDGKSSHYEYKPHLAVQLRVALSSTLPENLDFYISTLVTTSVQVDPHPAFIRLRFNYQNNGTKQFSRVRWRCAGEVEDCNNDVYLREYYTGVAGVYTMTSSKMWVDGGSLLDTPSECSQCWRSAVLAADTLRFYVHQDDRDITAQTYLWQDIITLSFRTVQDPLSEFKLEVFYIGSLDSQEKIATYNFLTDDLHVNRIPGFLIEKSVFPRYYVSSRIKGMGTQCNCEGRVRTLLTKICYLI